MNDLNLLAQSGPQGLEVLIPFGICVIVPVIWILTHHQRKMTELMHGSASRKVEEDKRLTQIERELAEVKALLQQQVIQNDDLRGLTNRVAEIEPLKTGVGTTDPDR